jgi:hypothetical protein
VYTYLSRGGEVFVPAFDTAAFPPLLAAGPMLRLVQRSSQLAFGLHAPSHKRAGTRNGGAGSLGAPGPRPRHDGAGARPSPVNGG